MKFCQAAVQFLPKTVHIDLSNDPENLFYDWLVYFYIVFKNINIEGIFEIFILPFYE